MQFLNKIHSFPFQFGFQFSCSPLLDGIVVLHNDIMSYLVLIFSFLCYLLCRIFFLFFWKKSRFSLIVTHSEQLFLELIWTVIPILILFLIGISSLSLLYSIEESIYNPLITVHVTGRQWYWVYEYSEWNLQFDSYLIVEELLNEGELRNLEVDNRLVLPSFSHIRLIISAEDVIHSFAVPSLGIKVDACPGRMNACHLFLKKDGIFYGQCSELCGVGHGFMPIVIQSVPIWNFMHCINYLLSV